MAPGRPAMAAAGAAAVLLVIAVGATAAEEPTERVASARPAAQFLDAMGVNTHWGYAATPYGSAYQSVLGRLVDLDLRHVRDGFNDRIEDLAEHGIATDVIVNPADGAPEAIKDRIAALNRRHRAIDAVEGPNEADLTWPKARPPTQFAGKGFPEGVVAFQHALYAAIKGDPATAAITVIGPSLGRTYNPGGGFPNPFAAGALGDAVDWGNFHPYPFGGNPFSPTFPYGSLAKYYHEADFPSVNLDEYPYGFQVYGPPFAPKPMAATETGYATYRGSFLERIGGVSETVQAKYVPRLYAEYFRLGVARTYLYELDDENADPASTDRKAHFGLLRHDLSPKPAYIALRSLTRLLSEADAASRSQAPLRQLRFILRAEFPPGYSRLRDIHHLLLQKTDGELLLLLWHEIANDDISTRPPREIAPAGVWVRLAFAELPQGIVQYDYDKDWTLAPHPPRVAGNAIEIEIPDRLTILRIGKVAAARR